MDVRVEYWHGRLPLEVVDGVGGPPDGVTRVYVRRGGETMILASRDVYWVAGDRFGCFNDPANYPKWGRERSGWCWPEGENPYRDDVPVPDGASVFRGVMLPDVQARKVGLL